MSEEKGYCEDLTEGKFSFPICHAIWTNDPRKGEILGILKSKTTDNMVKSHVVDCLEKSGSLEYTRMAMEALYERARELLDGIPERNPAIEAVLDKLILGVRASK
jgi:geranylgeranyl diphosphate synthase type 3